MPKATVRANAQALPEPTNRRAVLGAILAAGAIGALPAAARAASSHPDAELLALASEIEAADRECELRERAINAAETVFFSIRPKEPERPTITYQAMEELIAQKRWMRSPSSAQRCESRRQL